MSGARITIDGLWRCLCPSIDVVTLSSTTSLPYRPRLASRCHATTSTCTGPRVTTRALHTTRRQLQDGADKDVFSVLTDAEAQEKRGGAARWKTNSWETSPSKLGNAESGSGRQQESPPEASDGSGNHLVATDYAVGTIEQDRSTKADESRRAEGLESSSSAQVPAQEPEEEPTVSTSMSPDLATPWKGEPLDIPKRARGTVVELIMGMNPPYTELPAGVTYQKVMEAIRYIRQRGHPKWRRLTAFLVKYLLKSNNPPLTFIYETLLIGHALTEGSADVARSLLEEMRMMKIPWSQTAYHAAIRVRLQPS